MWTPANKYDVPTAEDSVMANDALNQLRRELEDALEQLSLAQCRVDRLRRDIGEREAWLAPVRRLPFDLLSLIFNISAEDDWRAPLGIGLVCRVWREAILTSPRAWTFIDLRDEGASQLLPLYLARSGQRGLHVGLQQLCDDEDFATVAQIADRIRCLSVPTLRRPLKGSIFINLERLRITNETTAKSMLQLNTTWFPRLHHLDYSYYKAVYVSSVGTLDNFPALQTLSLVGYGILAFSHILPACGTSLRRLRTFIDVKAWFPKKYVISLPSLESLVFFDARVGTMNTPLLMTPSLKTLVMGTTYDSDTFPLKMDLGTLTHVQAEDNQMPPLPALAGIKVLQLNVSPKILMRVFSTLARDPSTCPLLETVAFNSKGVRAFERPVIDKLEFQINARNSRNILFLSAPFTQPFPGHIEESVRNVLPALVSPSSALVSVESGCRVHDLPTVLWMVLFRADT